MGCPTRSACAGASVVRNVHVRGPRNLGLGRFGQKARGGCSCVVQLVACSMYPEPDSAERSPATIASQPLYTRYTDSPPSSRAHTQSITRLRHLTVTPRSPPRAGIRERPSTHDGGDLDFRSFGESSGLCAARPRLKIQLMHARCYATETVHKIKRDGSVSIRPLATLDLATAREAHGPGTHPT